MYQYYKGENVYYTNQGAVTVSSTYIPKLPNTGFEPLSGMSLAFAAVMLIAVTIVAYPYVRAAFTALRS